MNAALPAPSAAAATSCKTTLFWQNFWADAAIVTSGVTPLTATLEKAPALTNNVGIQNGLTWTALGLGVVGLAAVLGTVLDTKSYATQNCAAILTQ